MSEHVTGHYTIKIAVSGKQVSCNNQSVQLHNVVT